jgi:hypothetical protein
MVLEGAWLREHTMYVVEVCSGDPSEFLILVCHTSDGTRYSVAEIVHKDAGQYQDVLGGSPWWCWVWGWIWDAVFFVFSRFFYSGVDH